MSGTARHGDGERVQRSVGDEVPQIHPIEVARVATATKVVEPVCFDIPAELQGVISRGKDKPLRELPEILPIAEQVAIRGSEFRSSREAYLRRCGLVEDEGAGREFNVE